MHSSQEVDIVVVPAAESALLGIHFNAAGIHQMDVNRKRKKMKNSFECK
jgi:hypothetical protein